MRSQSGRLAKRCFTDLQQQQAEKFRKKAGLRVFKVSKRNCLKCDDKFSSFGPQNRLCDDCRDNVKPAEWGAQANVKFY